MNWSAIIDDLNRRGVTYEQIASECGFASKGHVADVRSERQRTVLWHVGDALIKMHRRVMRRKVQQ